MTETPGNKVLLKKMHPILIHEQKVEVEVLYTHESSGGTSVSR
jgi:hypothetical protein